MNFKDFLSGFGVTLVVALLVAMALLRPPPPPPPPTPSPPPTPPVTAPPTIPAVVWPLEVVAAPEVADDHDTASLLNALEKSSSYLKKKSKQAVFSFGERSVPVGVLQETMRVVTSKLKELRNTSAFHAWLRENCTFYESTADKVVTTGYHLAFLKGARKKSKKYPFPIYKRPDNLLRVDLHKFHFFEKFPGLPRRFNARVDDRNHVVPYFNREEIDFDGKLQGRKLEMLWVDDLVDLHSLHVQGSGVVELPDKSHFMVGFADSNGLKFRGVGGYLLEQRMIPRNQASYQGIQAFLKANPEKVREILSVNARYIFFRRSVGGARGSLGVEITPHRSIATDPSVFPRGALAMLVSEKPVFNAAGKLVRWQKFRRLVANQDTGSAIKGTGRVDLYHGFGEDNERLAGSMKQPGTLYFLLLKN